MPDRCTFDPTGHGVQCCRALGHEGDHRFRCSYPGCPGHPFSYFTTDRYFHCSLATRRRYVVQESLPSSPEEGQDPDEITYFIMDRTTEDAIDPYYTDEWEAWYACNEMNRMTKELEDQYRDLQHPLPQEYPPMPTFTDDDVLRAAHLMSRFPTTKFVEAMKLAFTLKVQAFAQDDGIPEEAAQTYLLAELVSAFEPDVAEEETANTTDLADNTADPDDTPDEALVYFIEYQNESGLWYDSAGGQSYGSDLTEAVGEWFKAMTEPAAVIDMEARTINGQPFRVTTEAGVVDWTIEDDGTVGLVDAVDGYPEDDSDGDGEE